MNENQVTTHTYQLAGAWLEDGWQDNVVIGVSDEGRITSIAPADSSQQADCSLDAVALPGMTNVHSHAFQRAFAGLSEFRTANRDSFWTWRRLMYDFLLQLTPEDVYVIARQLYLEMRLAGYTSVGEFHYIHQQHDGKPHAEFAAMAEAIVQAARETEIGLNILPVYYQRGGFDNSPLEGGQRRFGLTHDEFLKLYHTLRAQADAQVSVGIAIHSLRAVSIDAAQRLIRDVLADQADCRIHIHVAEQEQEVDECMQWHQRRPVQLLYDQFDVGPAWCLIHSTHIDKQEMEQIAQSGAVVGLCPTTEANLGDGFFPAPDFLKSGGAIAIGSDSHCSVDVRSELRVLEYGQRLLKRQRAILGTSQQSVGSHLYQQTARGGGQALGIEAGSIAVGKRADMTLVDPEHPAIARAKHDRLVDRFVFCQADDPVLGSIAGGKLTTKYDLASQQLVVESQLAFAELSDRLLSTT